MNLIRVLFGYTKEPYSKAKMNASEKADYDAYCAGLSSSEFAAEKARRAQILREHRNRPLIWGGIVGLTIPAVLIGGTMDGWGTDIYAWWKSAVVGLSTGSAVIGGGLAWGFSRGLYGRTVKLLDKFKSMSPSDKDYEKIKSELDKNFNKLNDKRMISAREYTEVQQDLGHVTSKPFKQEDTEETPAQEESQDKSKSEAPALQSVEAIALPENVFIKQADRCGIAIEDASRKEYDRIVTGMTETQRSNLPADRHDVVVSFVDGNGIKRDVEFSDNDRLMSVIISKNAIVITNAFIERGNLPEDTTVGVQLDDLSKEVLTEEDQSVSSQEVVAGFEQARDSIVDQAVAAAEIAEEMNRRNEPKNEPKKETQSEFKFDVIYEDDDNKIIFGRVDQYAPTDGELVGQAVSQEQQAEENNVHPEQQQQM